MSRRPYPAYKPSGVEWLGVVPKHWEVKRLKYGASINDEVLLETTDSGYEMSYVDISSVDAVCGIVAREEMVFESAPSRARRVVRDGDTIVSTVRTYLRAIAPIKDPTPNTVVSTGFAVVRPRKVAAGFLAHALREMGLVEAIVACSVGVSYPAVNASEIGTLPLPFPPPGEQRAIADFLDAETGKIDALVAKKRELIERLKEKRAALISRTVTRGLPPGAEGRARLPGAPRDGDANAGGFGETALPTNDMRAGKTRPPVAPQLPDGHDDKGRARSPNAPPRLKPSGIPWLGDVPEDWEVSRFSREVLIAEGQVDPEQEPWISMLLIAPNHIGPGTGRILGLETAGEQGAESGKYLCKKGEIVYSKIRPALAKVAIAPEDCLCSADMYPLRTRGRMEHGYLFWFLLSPEYTAWATLESERVAMPKVNRDTLGGAHLPVPPLPEQRAIAAFLDRETAKIDALATKVEEAIERLQEYRAALITAAVTGKIDVRRETQAEVPITGTFPIDSESGTN